MNAIFISFDRLLEIDVVFLDQIEIFMASAACLGKVRGMDMRQLIRGRQNVMLSVTIRTGWDINTLADFDCTMPLINVSFLGMAFAAVNRGQHFVMGKLLDPRVAVRASKITMDGCRKRFIDRLRDLANRYIMAF